MSKKNKKYIKSYRFPIGFDLGVNGEPILICSRKYNKGIPTYGVKYHNNDNIYWHSENVVICHLEIHGIKYDKKE